MSHLVELADKTALTWELDQMDFRGPFKAKSSVTSEFTYCLNIGKFTSAVQLQVL